MRETNEAGAALAYLWKERNASGVYLRASSATGMATLSYKHAVNSIL